PVLVGQRIEPSGGTNAVDVPLGEHGTHPGGQAAAAVEVAEERLPLAGAFAQAEQIRVERIGELTSATGAIDRLGRAIERGPMLPDEVIPGRLVSGRARAGQRQVVEAQRRDVLLDAGGRG